MGIVSDGTGVWSRGFDVSSNTASQLCELPGARDGKTQFLPSRSWHSSGETERKQKVWLELEWKHAEGGALYRPVCLLKPGSVPHTLSLLGGN